MFVTGLWEQNNKEKGKQGTMNYPSNQYTPGYMHHLPPQRKEPLRTSGSPPLKTDHLQFLLCNCINLFLFLTSSFGDFHFLTLQDADRKPDTVSASSKSTQGLYPTGP